MTERVSRIRKNIPAAPEFPTVEVPVLQPGVEYHFSGRLQNDEDITRLIEAAYGSGLVIFTAKLRGYSDEIYVIARSFQTVTTSRHFEGIVMQPGPVKVQGALFGGDQGYIKLA